MVGRNRNLSTASRKDLSSCFHEKPKPGAVGGEELGLAGPAGTESRAGGTICRVRNGPIVKPLQLLGGFWDGQGDSSTWLSPLLVPELPSLGWMRVRPRDSAVPRGTTHPDTPARTVTPVAPSVGHYWVPLAERGWWHLSHGPALSHHM